GVNPITALGALLDEVPALERRLRKLCRRSPHLRPPTVTPTGVRAPAQGIEQPNVIPSRVQALLDIRLTSGPDESAVAREIDAACRRAKERCPGSRVEWEPVSGCRRATRVERSEPLVRAMIAGVRQATGRRAVFGGVPGSTDGTILRMQLGIPIVTCGPGHRLIPHQADEYVDAPDRADAPRLSRAPRLTYLAT